MAQVYRLRHLGFSYLLRFLNWLLTYVSEYCTVESYDKQIYPAYRKEI